MKCSPHVLHPAEGRLVREAVLTVQTLLVLFPIQYLYSGCTTVWQIKGKTSIKMYVPPLEGMNIIPLKDIPTFVVLMMVVETCRSKITHRCLIGLRYGVSETFII